MLTSLGLILISIFGVVMALIGFYSLLKSDRYSGCIKNECQELQEIVDDNLKENQTGKNALKETLAKSQN